MPEIVASLRQNECAGINPQHVRAAGGGGGGGGGGGVSEENLQRVRPATAAAAAALLRQRREHQQRQRRQHQRPRGLRVIAVTSRRAAEETRTVAAANPAARGPGEGPRLWGPEDWEDSPTMSMLTEPSVRQEENPQMEEGGRPGPIWRAAFGGMRDNATITISGRFPSF